MNSLTKQRALRGLQWTVGLVLIVESLRLAFEPSAARHFARTGLPLWMRPVLAWTEIAAAIFFLVPFTTLWASYALLVVFFVAALLHVLHGEFDVGVLVVYSMAVLVGVTHRGAASSELAHDG